MKRRLHIAVLAGGDSSEYGISIKSGNVVCENLAQHHDVYLIEVKGNTWTYTHEGTTVSINKNDFSLPWNGKVIHFDVAFIAIHGTPGEDGKLQGYFDMLHLPYTTGGVLPLALTFNKGFCNSFLAQNDVPCANRVQLYAGKPYQKEDIIAELGLPCFVKPNQAGSSYGVSKVSDINQFDQAVREAFIHDQQVVVESLLTGREVTCGVHDFSTKPTALPVTEIITTNDFFDFEAKYEGKSQEITPAQISESQTIKVQQQAIAIYELLGLTGVARVDFMLTEDIPYVIEVNTVPGLSAESLIPQQAIAAGYSLPDFFNQWVQRALR